jgi:FSR family fosmidomycin resistance protein-like MFS transporter
MQIAGEQHVLAHSTGLQKGPVWTLSGAHFLNDLMTVGIVPALLPLYKEAFQLSYTQTGLIVLVSYLTSSVLQPIFGMITDRNPQTWLLSFGVFMTCFGLALTGIAPSFLWVLFFIGLSGLGSGVFHPEASRGAQLSAGKARGLAQAIFQVGGNLGQAIGPLMVPLFLLATGIRGLLFFLILAAAAGWMTWRILPWYKRRVEEERQQQRSLRGHNRPVAVTLLALVVVLRSWCQIGVAGFLPFYYQSHGISLAEAEVYTFIFLGAGALGTFLGGVLSDKFGRKWLVFGSILAAVPFAWALPHASGAAAILVLFCFGLTILSSFAATVVYAHMLLPGNLAMASGLMIGSGVGAGGIGAALFGSIADHIGVAAVFNLIVFLPVAAALLMVLLPSERKLAS